MKAFSDNLVSSLPDVGTSIFAVMTHAARQHNALNLSRGFPDFEVSAELIARAVTSVSHGTCFQLLDYSNINGTDDYEYSMRLIEEHGIASIPLSPFYHNVTDNKILRFCFADQNKILKKAADILCKI